MNKPEILELLNEFYELYIELNNQINKLGELFGSIDDGTLTDSIFKLQDFVIEVISKKTGIELEWLDWFIFENNWGKNELVCSINKKDYIINSIEKFIDFELLYETENINE